MKFKYLTLSANSCLKLSLLMNKNLITLLLIVLIQGACIPQKKAIYADDVITSEILVTLKAEEKVVDLIRDISKPVFSVKATLSARMLIYLLGYDDHKYDPTKALETLKEHRSVKSAEFNKKLGIRDQN